MTFSEITLRKVRENNTRIVYFLCKFAKFVGMSLSESDEPFTEVVEDDQANLINPSPLNAKLGWFSKLAFGAGNVLIEITNAMWITYLLLFLTKVRSFKFDNSMCESE